MTDGPQLAYDTVPPWLADQWRDQLAQAVATNRRNLGLDQEDQ